MNTGAVINTPSAAMAEAAALANLTARVGSLGRLDLLQRLVDRLRELYAAFPRDEMIAQEWGMSLVNLGNSGLPAHIIESLSELRKLRAHFPRKPRFATLVAAGISNTLIHYTRQEQIEQLESLFGGIARFRLMLRGGACSSTI